MWEKGGKQTSSYKQFIEMFHQVFDHIPKRVEPDKQLLAVKQGRGVVEYVLEFCIVTAGSGWNEMALKAEFLRVLTFAFSLS